MKFRTYRRRSERLQPDEEKNRRRNWFGRPRVRPLLLFIGIFSSILMLRAQAGLAAESQPGDKNIKVLLLPFSMHAAGRDTADISNQCVQALKKNLSDRKLTVLKASGSASGRSAAEKRALAKSEGTDYVLWGSLTKMGNAFSIDASLAKSRASGFLRHFFCEGTAEGHSLPAVKKLSSDIADAIYGHKRIAEINIEGNARIEASAIKSVIATEPGDPFNKK